MRSLLFVFLATFSLWGAEQKPFLFVTLQYNGEKISLLSADTVMGTERKLRFESESHYSYALASLGGTTLQSGSMPSPPPLHTSVAQSDGSLRSVPLSEVTWSFRIPLKEGAEELKIFQLSPSEGGSSAPSTALRSSAQEIASFSLRKGEETK